MAEVVEDRSPTLRAVCITLLVCSLVASGLRCYTRLGILRAFGPDDWTMVAANIAYIIYIACAITGSVYGIGHHKADLPPQNVVTGLMYWWLCYLWYGLTMLTSKVSIGIFFLRLTVSKHHRRIVYVAIGLTIVTSIALFFVNLLQCSPISYFWNRAEEGKCIPSVIMAYLLVAYSAVAMLCDFTFALLPIFMMMKLQMDNSIKLALSIILGMGCLASVAVIVRLTYIHDLNNPDFLWSSFDVMIWSAVEQGLAITAGSLACLRPLFRNVLESMGLWAAPKRHRLPEGEVHQTIGTIGSNDKNKSKKSTNPDSIGMDTLMRDDGDAVSFEGHAKDKEPIVISFRDRSNGSLSSSTEV
ncbi:hypothetical protein BX600DRAFT_460764 [Xylariales sp. PMI_506]|nr:hypothetical protein BX600DRAFT_460764 [Xylariales sp. PMI_506]